MARQTSPAPVLPRRRLLHHRMTRGGDGGRRWCPPHRRRLTLAGHEAGGDGRKKRARGDRLRRPSPHPPLASRSSRRTPSFKRVSPRWRGERRAQRASPQAVPGGFSRPAAQHRGLDAARTRRGGRTEEQRQVPAGRPELFMGEGGYYIRSHKLEPLCNAIRERYARPLLLSSSRSL